MKDTKQLVDQNKNNNTLKEKKVKQDQELYNFEKKQQSKQDKTFSKELNLHQHITEVDDCLSNQSLQKNIEQEEIFASSQDQNSKSEKNHENQEDQWKQYNFFMNTGLIGKIFLVDVFKLLLKAAKDSSLYKKISLKHLPHLFPEHRVESIHEILQKYLDQAIEKAEQNGKTLEGVEFVWIFVKIFKWQILIVLLFCVSCTTATLIAAVQIKYLVQSVENNGVTQEAYFIALKLGFSMIYYSLFFHNIPRLNQLMYSLFRNAFMKALFYKISSLSSYSVKNADVGKLINIATNDLATVEGCFTNVMDVIQTPYPFFITSYLIYNSYGYMGLIAIFFISISYPIQGLVSVISTHYYGQKSKIIDERVNQTNEIIEGIRIIKMYAWEEPFKRIIKILKLQEFKKNIIIQISNLMCRSIDNVTGLLGTTLLFSLVYYHSDGRNLDAGTIFSTLCLLQILKNQVYCAIGLGILGIFQLQVILERMASIFAIKNTSMTCIEGNNSLENKDIKLGNIEFSNFTAYWQQNTPVLQDINLSIKQGECVGIVGKVGSGKTSLLNCILSEIPLYKGNFKFNGKLAYVEQEPYIFNSTIKENITFGKEFNQDLYDKVIKSCCLLTDLQQFDQKDETEIGERGLNISGGQKSRISLARALYSQADIYLLDDPLSAVDANVAQKIFFDAIKEFCKGSTILLVTHQVHFTRHTDKIIILEEGEIKIQGTHSELEQDLIQLSKQLSLTSINDEQNSEEESLEYSQSIDETKEKKEKKEKQKSYHSYLVNKNNKRCEKDIQNKEDELSENTRVSLETYKFFYNLSTLPWSSFVIIALFASSEILFIIYNRTLGQIKTDDEKTVFGNLWWIIFTYFIVQIFKNILIVVYFNDNAFNLHEKMINSLLRATIQFFDLTPSGNILNLFSTDIGNYSYFFMNNNKEFNYCFILFFLLMAAFIIYKYLIKSIGLIDSTLGMIVAESSEILISVILLLGYVSIIAPYFSIVFLFSFLSLLFFIYKTKHALYHTKQLDLNLRAPIFTFFNVVVSGVLPIRIYKKSQYFEKQFNELSNNSLRATWYFLLTARGFGSQINLYSGISSALGILVIVYVLNSGPLIGQAVVFFMSSNEQLQWGVRQMIQADIIMSSYQRCKYLVEQKHEPELKTNYDKKNFDDKKSINTNQQSSTNILEINSSKFPSKGEVIFKNVQMKYGDNLNYVLKDISFTISPGNRVGIVGRTGAGKSSIIQALFRMTDIEDNNNFNKNVSFQNIHGISGNTFRGSGIFIDGHNIKDLGLHTLRQGISIIPQLPFIFSGTIRFNLDPLNLYSDKQIEDVLEDIQLLEKVNSLENKMHTDMRNTLQLFSSGQKQLICLGRAILRQSKLTVLDEATASIDMLTDQLIQKKIRQRFEHQTIIAIAHRLNTIADYDQIIVVDQGLIVEQGTPYNLLQNQNSQFFKMVAKTGKKNSNNILKKVQQNYNKKTVKEINQN